MVQTKTLTNYDLNAIDFDQFRQPNPAIAEILTEAFSLSEGPILSVGCGTGQYESILSKSIPIIGLDRSWGMINKANHRIQDVVLGDMTSLPFPGNCFSGSYFMQSLHHVGANLSISASERKVARINTLKEVVSIVNRGPIFIVQRDPSQNQAVWFWKFFPRALEVKLTIQPRIETLVHWLEDLGLKNVSAVPIHDPMIRGFYNPEAPLDPGFRRSFSEFSYLSEEDIEIGICKLQSAIHDGSVMDAIEECKLRFAEIGGTVFVVSGEKI